MSNESKLGAAFRLKCPRCRTGNLFIDPNPYNLSMLGKMPRECPHCKLKLEPETGFYYGAMWISYAVGVLLSVIIICLAIFAFHMDVLWAFIIMVIFHLIISPYLFRFSRALWISFYVNYHRDI